MADSGEHTIGLDGTEAVAEVEEKITPDMRFYYLHREERKKKQLERYHNDPVVIAKREEKARKRAEKEAQKEAEKEAKRIERERQIKENLSKALKTSKKIKPKTDGRLDEFLIGTSSGL